MATEHRIQARAAQLLQLLQHLHGHGALAGDHVRVVKGVDKGQALFFCSTTACWYASE